MHSRFDVPEIASWLELASRIMRLSAAPLIQRIRDGEPELVDAIKAILAVDHRPSQRLDALRDFLVQQTLGVPPDPTADGVEPSSPQPDPSPFAVPQRFLDLWFPIKTRPPEPPVEALLCIKQFYDCIDLTPDLPRSKDMFSYDNIGRAGRTNLQVGGQLTTDDTPVLLTSWWITTTTWSGAERFLSRAFVDLRIGERWETTMPALELWRRRQSLLTPVPIRQNLTVRFGHNEEPLALEHAPPLYVFLEGWGRRRTRMD